MPDCSSRGHKLRIRHEGQFYPVYAASDCYTETSFWSSETSYMDLEMEGKSVLVTCSGPAQQQCKESHAAGSTGGFLQEDATEAPPGMVHHQYRAGDSHDPFLSQNAASGLLVILCLYWCLTANVTFSRRKRKDEGPTCSETRLTSAAIRMESGETKNLNFTSIWGSLPDPVMSRPTSLAVNWQQHPKDEVPLLPAWPQTLGKDWWDTRSREWCWESTGCQESWPANPTPELLHRMGPPAMQQSFPEPRETSSSTQVTDTASVAFISCSKS